MMRALFLLFAVAAAPAVSEGRQAARPSPPSAQEQQLAEPYTYHPQGRRDPFVSLLGTGETHPTVKRGEGSAALASTEIALRGVVQSRGGLLAMIEGPDKKTYLVHAGDKLADGTIKSVTVQGLVIVQEINDPLSPIKQREIRKALRASEDAKQ